jgi:hypothetical protein
MKYRYSRYVEDLLDSIDLESLVSQLSDLLLSSGFNNPWDPQSDDDLTMTRRCRRCTMPFSTRC